MLKKILLIGMIYNAFMVFNVVNVVCVAAEQVPVLTAKSAVVMDALTGEVLYEKNSNARSFPASTTKIMTSIVAIERGNLNDIVVASANAASTEGSSLNLTAGEKLILLDMLYGMLMVSGNDSCVAVAEHLAGSTSSYAAWMTEKAHKIGAKNTNFVNVNGLPNPMHYTTAYDLALMAAYGYKIPVFAKIVGTKEKIIPWTGKDFKRELFNTNKLLWNYEGANGVKTGYTNIAGNCLVSGAKRMGVQLVAVVLDSDFEWLETKALLDYGFSRVTSLCYFTAGEAVEDVWVRSGEKSKVSVVVGEPFNITLLENQENVYTTVIDLPVAVNAPISKGQQMGTLSVMYKNKEVAKLPLLAGRTVEKKSFFLAVYKFLRGY